MMLVDSHAHLELVEDLEGALARAKEAGVSKIISVGSSVESSKKAIEIAEKYSSSDLTIFATCGIHPKDGKGDIENLGISDCMRSLREIAKPSKKVVAIGECGLDYFNETRDTKHVIRKATSHGEKEFQRKLFGEQIKLALELDLPLVVHCRNAWDEIFELLTLNNEQLTVLRGVFHSFTGGVEEVRKAADLGFYVSFSGIVTFSDAQEIKSAAKKVPPERILVETDSPFLSPEPLRGRKNEPGNVKITAGFISSLRGSSLYQIADMTTRNACEVFRA